MTYFNTKRPKTNHQQSAIVRTWFIGMVLSVSVGGVCHAQAMPAPTSAPAQTVNSHTAQTLTQNSTQPSTQNGMANTILNTTPNPAQPPAHLPPSPLQNPQSPIVSLQDAPLQLQDTQDFNQQFNDFLLSDTYSHKNTEGFWRAKHQKESRSVDYEKVGRWLEWLEPFFKWLGKLDGAVEGLSFLLKILLVSALLGVIFWLFSHFGDVVVAVAQKLSSRRATINAKRHAYRPSEKLPDIDELMELIGQFIRQGEYLKALSLLYRGSLRQLELVHDLPITDSQTEAQCQALLATARHRTQAEVAFFDELVAVWQLSAYGRRVPKEPSVVERLFGVWQTLYVGTASNDGEHD